jgi:amidase
METARDLNSAQRPAMNASPQKHATRRASDRRGFLRGLGRLVPVAAVTIPTTTRSAPATTPTPTADPATDITEWSALRLARAIRERKVSSTEAVEAFLRRIDRVNPLLNAVVTLCAERARMEARIADERLAKGLPTGPLHGVPMTIKDSLDTAGVRTTGGTLGWLTRVPGADSTAVARVRAAGAILLGKTNTPEFTLGSPGLRDLGTTSNILFGVTRNPYDPARSCGGSSGGAGSIVAAGGSAFDIGSDFGGSIRNPAHCNGIVGLKPTTGRVPRTGHVVDFGGVYDTYQQIGPMARRVEDIALLLPLLAGPDFQDAAIKPMPNGDPSAVDLKKLRVAFFTDVNGYHGPTRETVAMVAAAAKAMEGIGCPVAESAPSGYMEAYGLMPRLRDADGGAWIGRVNRRVGTTPPSPGRVFDGPMLPVPEFEELLELQDTLRSRMLSWFRDFDVLLCPTDAAPARIIGEKAPQTTSYRSLFNLTGWPAIVVRAGTSPEGLPIGLQIVARPWREDVAIAVASEMEARFGGWKKPRLAAS